MSSGRILGILAALACTDPYGESFGTPRKSRPLTKEEQLRNDAINAINSFTPEQREEAKKWDHKRFPDEPLNQYELRMKIRDILWTSRKR